jgi:hypothetical protein
VLDEARGYVFSFFLKRRSDAPSTMNDFEVGTRAEVQRETCEENSSM